MDEEHLSRGVELQGVDNYDNYGGCLRGGKPPKVKRKICYLIIWNV